MGKKLQVLLIVVSLFVCGYAVNANAAGDVKVGLGYEGMIMGSFLQGISARAWMGPLGLEGNIFTGRVKAEADGDTLGKADLNAIGLKAMFAPIVKANSKFYVGADIGYGKAKFEAGDLDADGKVWLVGPFFGAEYFFQEIPELGFNWEVGYKFSKISLDVPDEDANADLKLDGINIVLGVHYYF
jgi:hypothetical protein